MTWVPSRDLSALALAAQWGQFLGRGNAHDSLACVWATRREELPRQVPPEWRLCWHALDVPSSIDRHVADQAPNLPWSPWGTKSGPNFQFFSILDRIPNEHDDEWTLLIEPDTSPLGPSEDRAASQTLAANPEAWMIGGKPHPSIRGSLGSDMQHHLNGAALYHVRDPEFAEFRATVWIPSLLLILRSRPTLAFDCLTDAATRLDLPAALRQPWDENAWHFVATSGIINASKLDMRHHRLADLIADPEVQDALSVEGTSPWMLHAKGITGSQGDAEWLHQTAPPES